MMVVALVDRRRDDDVPALIRGRIAAIPLGLAAALVLFASAYWGSHAVIYDHGAGSFIVAEVAEHHASH
jgi:hypothetical protein